MNQYPEYESDIAFCREINKKYGKSFYAGTLFFSPEERDATFVLYSFFRLPDEYVDTDYADQKDMAAKKIQRWNDAWHKCFAGEAFDIEEDERRILRATKHVFETYKIPFSYSEDFIAAMKQDLTKDRYASYEELREYMHGSACVVGLMMTYIMCANDVKFQSDAQYRDSLLEKAAMLGEAFQVTNFLRDIGEDFRDRNRIYIPQEDMAKYHISEDEFAHAIETKTLTPNIVSLIKYRIDTTRQLYLEADKAIRQLPPRAGLGVHIARVLYSQILRKIELNNYDTLSKRLSLSSAEKLLRTLVAVIRVKMYN
jgi:phytoene synthase